MSFNTFQASKYPKLDLWNFFDSSKVLWRMCYDITQKLLWMFVGSWSIPLVLASNGIAIAQKFPREPDLVLVHHQMILIFFEFFIVSDNGIFANIDPTRNKCLRHGVAIETQRVPVPDYNGASLVATSGGSSTTAMYAASCTRSFALFLRRWSDHELILSIFTPSPSGSKLMAEWKSSRVCTGLEACVPSSHWGWHMPTNAGGKPNTPNVVDEPNGTMNQMIRIKCGLMLE